MEGYEMSFWKGYKENNMPKNYRFTRTIFGIIMISAIFYPQGKYVVAVLGALFILSAFNGFCITCWLYDKIWGCEECKVKITEKGKNSK
jgi:hypothetical protein